MPRTKVSKSSKRNREEHSSREMKIREFHELLEMSLNDMETTCMEEISLIESEVQMLLDRTNSGLLKMKMAEFLKLDIDNFHDWNSESLISPPSKNKIPNIDNCSIATVDSITSRSSNLISGTMLRSGKPTNDEGYLTEDSGSIGGSVTQATIVQINSKMAQVGRTPGPLSSARARRLRRSRSACDTDRVPGSTLKPLHSANNNIHRASRSKMRTPTAAPRHAFSADRTNRIDADYTTTASNRNIQQSPPAAFMRWPKPGEMLLSTCGSPIIAQVMPDRFANVNIPVKNGILSLRPKKLDQLKTDIIDAIDIETLHQIKTLNANLDLIVAMADKANALK